MSGDPVEKAMQSLQPIGQCDLIGFVGLVSQASVGLILVLSMLGKVRFTQ